MDREIAMDENGNCSLLIYGDRISFNEIEEELGLKATHIVEKGKPISKYSSNPLRICETNGWFYDTEYNGRDDFSNALGLFLSKIHPQKDKLKMIAESDEDTDIFITISASSDYAQMFLEIEPEHQKLIAELGFPLRFSILSFGMVEGGEDEDEDCESNDCE